jgi:hypothetical protein
MICGVALALAFAFGELPSAGKHPSGSSGMRNAREAGSAGTQDASATLSEEHRTSGQSSTTSGLQAGEAGADAKGRVVRSEGGPPAAQDVAYEVRWSDGRVGREIHHVRPAARTKAGAWRQHIVIERIFDLDKPRDRFITDYESEWRNDGVFIISKTSTSPGAPQQKCTYTNPEQRLALPLTVGVTWKSLPTNCKEADHAQETQFDATYKVIKRESVNVNGVPTPSWVISIAFTFEIPAKGGPQRGQGSKTEWFSPTFGIYPKSVSPQAKVHLLTGGKN